MAALDDVLGTITADLAARRCFPESTYRLQFHAGFTFRDARALAPYLRDLGVTHAYASPYLQARPGSKHGYDITNHQTLNPEIGTPAEYDAWVDALHGEGLGQILDVVPNHMGVTGNENAWWNDVLENGPSSPYAGYFDISWHSSPRPELRGRVLIPILGEPYGQVLESGQLRLSYDGGAFTVHYFDNRFPVAPRSYGLILGLRTDELERVLGPNSPHLVEYQSILTAISHLPRRSDTEPEKVQERQREKEVIKRRLATLTQESPQVRAFIEENVALFNGKPGEPRSFDLLDELLDDQAYRLSFWRVAADEINYRRFFDINDLAALSMERPEVFEATHDLVLRLLAEGKVNGLRIDHPDGLYDPKQYLQRLQRAYALACAHRPVDAQPEGQRPDWAELEKALLAALDRAGGEGGDDRLRRLLYVVVEKILGAKEPLPEDWPVDGTVGYDFLNMVNGVFVDAGQAEAFTWLYQDWTHTDLPFAEVVYQKKFLTLQVSLSSELHMLAYQLDRLAQKSRWSRDFTLNSLRHALREVIACFPVYRSYTSDEGVRAEDRGHVERAVSRAMARNPTLNRSLFRFIRDMLLLKYPETWTEADRAEQRRFVGKFQQVTSPVMAKGLEDTAFYVYNRLTSLNEVGGDPGRFGVKPAQLHQYCRDRQTKWPWSLSPLSTHDTKRSEDVRARLNVLSECPGEWGEALARWGRLNETHRRQVEDLTVPDANEEYLLYQTLLGAWPLEPHGPEEYAEFVRRVQAYLVKALHEAKVHTSWINPNAEYDQAAQDFVARILDEQTNAPFLDDFRPFQRRLSHYGLLNSLAQTVLKVAAPGVPDTYQGTELWDFSLVDPDNRRPVDYERRRRLLAEQRERLASAGDDRRELVRELLEHRTDGRVKLYVTTQALHARKDRPGLFATGEYRPAEPAGARAENAFGFVRHQGDRWAIAAVPRQMTRLVPGEGQLPLGPAVWQDTRLLLPGVDPQARFGNVFTGEAVTLREEQNGLALPLAEAFAHFPVALFVAGK
jgi:(1->4)-alpha-D-glucan 1-alpha-D-glucosylmutase